MTGLVNPSFDPHEEAVNGVAPLAFSDPEISRLDLMEDREWVREAVARSRRVYAAPVPYVPTISIHPVAHARKSHSKLAWVAGILALVVFALLGLAAVMFL